MSTIFNSVNTVGHPIRPGFGVGIAPMLPEGFSEMTGTRHLEHDNYGNYQHKDGSVMVWVPRFDVGFAGKLCMILDPDQITPKGFVRTRMPAFWNAGKWQPGFFIDKYKASAHGGVAVSIKGGIPLSAARRKDTPGTGFGDLTFNGQPVPANLGGAFLAAKTRGDRFFVSSLQMRFALGMLVRAQQEYGTAETCEWLSLKSKRPAGCTDGNLGSDFAPGLKYEWDGTYSGAAKTGSASNPALVSHNGQRNGVMDLCGLLWEVHSGVSSKNGKMTAPDAAHDLAQTHLHEDANWEPVGLPHHGSGSIDASRITHRGIELAVRPHRPGDEWFYASSKMPDVLCAVSGGYWASGSDAGVWALALCDARGASSADFGFRAASYL